MLDRRPGWGGGKLNATTVLLEPLVADETASLIEQPPRSTPGRATSPPDPEAAEGNPLFVEEMVAMLA